MRLRTALSGVERAVQMTGLYCKGLAIVTPARERVRESDLAGQGRPRGRA